MHESYDLNSKKETYQPKGYKFYNLLVTLRNSLNITSQSGSRNLERWIISAEFPDIHCPANLPGLWKKTTFELQTETFYMLKSSWGRLYWIRTKL